jgi:putative N6-adenine-specific DNA methylase
MGPAEEGSGPEARIFVRAESDRFTVSLDSSGELLHKRGVKARGGKAPIRETLASAVLNIAGYGPGQLLADPMCGSGTFSLEAAMMSRNLPSGWFRDFAFMQWPAFSPGRWRHLRKEAEAEISPPGRTCVFASDLRESEVRLLETRLLAYGLSDAVRTECLDFMALTPGVIFKKLEESGGGDFEPGLLVINPPYGRRLGSLSESRRLFAEILEKLRKDFRGWHAAVIVPGRLVGKRTAKFFSKTPLFHGGLDLVLLTGKIPGKK